MRSRPQRARQAEPDHGRPRGRGLRGHPGRDHQVDSTAAAGVRVQQTLIRRLGCTGTYFVSGAIMAATQIIQFVEGSRKRLRCNS